jgi:hypothetical protein
MFAVVVVLLALVGVIGKLKGRHADLHFERREFLFSPAERSFLGVLDQALGVQFRVFGKVRIADVLATTKSASRSARTIGLNKTVGKHFDFVVCDAATLSVVCAVELDDKSHARDDRRSRDAFVEHACRTSRLPLMRIAARKSYSLADIRASFDGCIQPASPPPLSAPVRGNEQRVSKA